MIIIMLSDDYKVYSD